VQNLRDIDPEWLRLGVLKRPRKAPKPDRKMVMLKSFGVMPEFKGLVKTPPRRPACPSARS
jgi:hypothetical protein